MLAPVPPTAAGNPGIRVEGNQHIPARCLIAPVLEDTRGRLAGNILLCGTPPPPKGLLQ